MLFFHHTFIGDHKGDVFTFNFWDEGTVNLKGEEEENGKDLIFRLFG